MLHLVSNTPGAAVPWAKRAQLHLPQHVPLQRRAVAAHGMLLQSGTAAAAAASQPSTSQQPILKQLITAASEALPEPATDALDTLTNASKALSQLSTTDLQDKVVSKVSELSQLRDEAVSKVSSGQLWEQLQDQAVSKVSSFSLEEQDLGQLLSKAGQLLSSFGAALARPLEVFGDDWLLSLLWLFTACLTTYVLLFMAPRQ